MHSATIRSRCAPSVLPSALATLAAGGQLDVVFHMKRQTLPIVIGRDGASNPIAVDALTTLQPPPAIGSCSEPVAAA